jgi:HPt (histidine-containing phosphotransfer) domain-containing protein
VNRDRLARLREQAEAAGEPNGLAELAEVFLDSARASAAAIRGGVAAGDVERVSEAAHDLAGSAATIGAATLAGVCVQIEEIGRGGDLGPAAALVDTLDRELARAAQVLAEEAAPGRR